MADICAFRGLRYDSGRAGKLESVVAPPWDIISDEDRSRLRALSPFNVVNLTLPEAEGKWDKFKSCARLLDEWQTESVLVRDEAPCMYRYRHTFELGGQRLSRTGIIASLAVGGNDVRGHEETRVGPKKERLDLLSATRSVLEPIFMLCADSEERFREALETSGEGDGATAEIDLDGERHELTVIDSEAFHSEITDLLRRETVVIADGHHRYGASVENLAAAGSGAGEESWRGRIMVYLVSENDPGLVVLPSHRLVKGIRGSLEECLERVKAVADVKRAGDLNILQKEMADGDDVRIGVCGNGGRSFYLLRAERYGDDGEDVFDVDVLHESILLRMLDGNAVDVQMAYIQDAEEGVSVVESGDWDMCFLVRGVEPQDVVRTAKNGRFMPAKSTYFSPKPLSGLVLMAER